MWAKLADYTPGERDELYRIVHRPEELLRMAPIAEAIEAVKHSACRGSLTSPS